MDKITFHLKVLVNLSIVSIFFTLSVCGQDKITGPVIINYGDTYQFNNVEYKPKFKDGLKLVFDITKMGTNPNELSSQINTIARCINMHAASGIELEEMDIYAVFHSEGTFTLFNKDIYSNHYAANNPHYDLLSELSDVGVKLIVCGQSLGARNVRPAEIHPKVKIALSAMTVLADLQMQGYALIKF